MRKTLATAALAAFIGAISTTAMANDPEPICFQDAKTVINVGTADSRGNWSSEHKVSLHQVDVLVCSNRYFGDKTGGVGTAFKGGRAAYIGGRYDEKTLIHNWFCEEPDVKGLWIVPVEHFEQVENCAVAPEEDQPK